MRIISRKRLVDFWKRWPAAESPLKYWHSLARRAKWKSFLDVKGTFGQTDQARVKSGNVVEIFDIGGNKFRLIAKIHYNKLRLYVLRILTHKEYDTGKWKDDL